MIFVYPALVSENVDSRMVPTISRTLEKFFLLHICESFQNNTLRVKSVYDPGKKVYGPFLLENKNILSESISGKSDDKLTDELKGFIDDKDDLLDKIDQTSSLRADTQDQIDELYNQQRSIKSKMTQLDKDSQEYSDAEVTIETLDQQIEQYKKTDNRYKNEINDLRDKLRDVESRIKAYKDAIDERKFSAGDKSKGFSGKTERDTKRFGWEEEDRKSEDRKSEDDKKKTHASYKVDKIEGIDLRPAMSNIDVKVHYVGSPNLKDSVSTDKEEVAVGVKILPQKVTDFDNIQYPLLDDYFSSSVNLKFKSIYRVMTRKSFRFVEKLVKKIIGTDIDIASQDPSIVNREIFFQPNGFVDASTFKNKSNSPSFYKYTSAIVIMNKDDVMEDGQNFFEDQTKLRKMFKAGWSTFCILDEVNEEVIVVSKIDGGALHVIPYRYIFNSMKMDKVYEDFDALKRANPLFMRSRGNIRTLSRQLTKESKMLDITRKILNG